VTPLLEQLGSFFGDARLWAWLATLPFIAGGFLGLVLPALPGSALLLAGFVVYGLIAGFEGLTRGFWLGQCLLALAGHGLDYLATVLGVRMQGGSRAAVWGAMLGLAAIFFIGPFGIVLGPLVGAVAGELLLGRSHGRALRSGLGTVLGLLLGTLGKLVLGCLMCLWFVLCVW